ncbi:MAG: class I adenylate-forming enzyme family protein, partial [Candidatus Dormibacteria bacterium]
MQPTTVPGLLAARVQQDPAHIALVVHDGPVLTYAEWDERSDVVARGLMARGVRAGDRVALYFDNARWVEYAACYLGAHKAGAVAVPLSSRFSLAELHAAVRHAAVALLVAHRDASPAAADVAKVTVDELLASAERRPVDRSREDDIAEIIYTSGTTAEPKGVACTHRNLLAHDLPPDAAVTPVFLHAFPIGTNAGQECLRMPLRRTATAVVLPAFDPEQLCAAVSRHRVRRLQLVPAMAQLIVESGAAARHDVSSVARVILSSAPPPPE